MCESGWSRRLAAQCPAALYLAAQCLTALCLVVVSLGCESAPPTRDAKNPAAYVELTLTKASTEQAITDEVARLNAAGMILHEGSPIPLEGFEQWHNALDPPFAEQFPTDAAQAIYEATSAIYPRGEFAFRPHQVQAAIELRQTHDRFLARFRRYMQRQHLAFGLDLRQGLLADTSLVPVARAGHRLEALEAAVKLDQGEVDLAIDCLAAMLQISATLDDLPHVVPRLVAAELREEASHLLEAIANHRRAGASQRARLATIVSAQLAAWPADRWAWIGDRAVGLHAYEMVRDGQLVSLLTAAELEQLSEQGSLAEVIREITLQVDRDQAYYLNFMRELIEACDQPYEQRLAVIADMQEHLEATRGSPEYPLVAAQLLLKDLGAGNRRQVSDRALWQAIGVLLEPNGSGSRLNPLTGNPYEVVTSEATRTIELSLGDQQQRVIELPRAKP